MGLPHPPLLVTVASGRDGSWNWGGWVSDVDVATLKGTRVTRGIAVGRAERLGVASNAGALILSRHSRSNPVRSKP